MKRILKGILGVVFVVGLLAGSIYVVHEFIKDDAPESDIYKEETKRDSKYNGVYTLTKLDENGNNTWDGLVCYVKNDKIIDGVMVDFISNEELIRDEFGDAEANVDEDTLTSLILERVTGLEYGSIGEISAYGAGTAATVTPNGHLIDKMNFEAYKTELNINDKKIYNALYKSGLLAGYDEDSQEVWMSKLINNEKSSFHDYKLIHYASSSEMEKKCEIYNPSYFEILNGDYNAGLNDN